LPTRIVRQWIAVDISIFTAGSEFGRQIHPCKSCVSTSMRSVMAGAAVSELFNWARRMIGMNEIYPLWVAAAASDRGAGNWYHRRQR